MDSKTTCVLSKNSGVEVSILGCGGGPLGDMYFRLDPDEAVATVTAAHDAGLTLFDTSPFYGHGLSSRWATLPYQA